MSNCRIDCQNFKLAGTETLQVCVNYKPPKSQTEGEKWATSQLSCPIALAWRCEGQLMCAGLLCVNCQKNLAKAFDIGRASAQFESAMTAEEYRTNGGRAGLGETLEEYRRIAKRIVADYIKLNQGKIIRAKDC